MLACFFPQTRRALDIYQVIISANKHSPGNQPYGPPQAPQDARLLVLPAANRSEEGYKTALIAGGARNKVWRQCCCWGGSATTRAPSVATLNLMAAMFGSPSLLPIQRGMGGCSAVNGHKYFDSQSFCNVLSGAGSAKLPADSSPLPSFSRWPR